jgi:hypothetical protein
MKRGVIQYPALVCEVYTFMSDFQAVLTHLESLKHNPLPACAYNVHAFGGYVWGNATAMREAGIANFQQV